MADVIADELDDSTQSEDSVQAALNEDILVLDPEEYRLPPAGALPSLESILSEDDTVSRSSIDSFSKQTDNVDTCGGGGAATVAPSTGGGRNDGSSHLQCSQLPEISAQLQSAMSRAAAGNVTCMSCAAGDGGDGGAPTLLAVGMSHGVCLVFERLRAVRLCVGDEARGADTGAVSAVHVAPSSDRLLVGFARGQIHLYELEQGRRLAVLLEAFERCVAILRLRFTAVSGVALFGDSGGCVFELRMRRQLSARLSLVTRCVFSGSRGEVVVFEPLPIEGATGGGRLYKRGNQRQRSDSGDSLAQRLVVAMATLSKVIVVQCRPSLRVLFTYSVEASLLHAPLLCWQYVVIQRAPAYASARAVKRIEPVLAFARASRVYFVQVSWTVHGEVTASALQSVEVSCQLRAIHWLDARSLALLDSGERLRLWDVRRQRQLQVLDLSHVKLVYSASFFKGLATGGNVSKAMSVVADSCCFESLSLAAGQLFLLGAGGCVFVVRVRSWLQRIDALLTPGSSDSGGGGETDYLAALRLAASMYADAGDDSTTSACDPHGNVTSKRLIIRERMLAIIEDWMQASIGAFKSAEHCATVVTSSVKYIVQLRLFHVLFERAYSVFELDSRAHTLYLHALESHIIEGQIEHVPAEIMKHIVQHCLNTQQYKRLEECVVRVDLASLDINQVLPVCWQRGLYDAVLYIHTEGMHDFVSPLTDMLAKLEEFINSDEPLSDAHVRLGHVMLVYISSCLAGRRYPRAGVLSAAASADVLSAAASADAVKWRVLNTVTCVHSHGAADTERPYPHLRTLLRFDTREFLNVLSLAFEEASFCSELGTEQRQRIINILIDVMLRSDDDQMFSSEQKGALFTFIAEQMALQSQSAVSVSDQIFDSMLDHLLEAGDSAYHERRQQALVPLITRGLLPRCGDTTALALRAEQAKFYSICELLYQQNGQHSRVLHSLLCYPAGRARVHDYLRSRVIAVTSSHDGTVTSSDSSVTSSDGGVASVLAMVLDNIQSLMEVSVDATANLLVSCFPSDVAQSAALSRLAAHSPALQYQLSTALLRYSSGAQLPTAIYTAHLELMCRHEPTAVVNFLQDIGQSEAAAMLEICRGEAHLDGQICLLEIMGRPCEALQLKMQLFSSLVGQLEDASEIGASQVDNVEQCVTACVHLCERAHQPAKTKTIEGAGMEIIDGADNVDQLKSATGQSSHSCWFALLDLVLLVHQRLTSLPDTKLQARGWSLLQLLISCMSSQLPLRQLLEQLLASPDYCGARLSQLRPLLTDMLDCYRYERVLLANVTRLLWHDRGAILRRRYALARRAFVWPPPSTGHDEATDPGLCCVCRQMCVTSSSIDGAPVVNKDGVDDERLGSVPEHTQPVVLLSCGHWCHECCAPTRAEQKCRLCAEHCLENATYVAVT